ncbi:Spc98 family-domain-containing protein [Ampelomyces quisqualis]|uniref:Spindle pole body component n=1 Tax=Ampelomyces quisqualis TaxID=50730 RepID=A0A6A5QBT8_AMPQU|nr:Spc98 family-domain-containing protein [Ampelomyces quisqualis]
MDDEASAPHVFSTRHLWKPSTLFDALDTHESTLFAPPQLDISAVKFDHPYAPKHELQRELRLPDLETFQFGPLPELDSPDVSSISLGTPSLEAEEDLWQAAFELGPADKDVLFHTWEAFEHPQHLETQTAYLTERGPETFDAALQADDAKVSAGKVLKGDVLLQSLWNLGLGRSSILYDFSPKLGSFEPTIAQGRASGVSLEASQSLFAQFVHTGNTFLYLRSFAERTFSSPKSIPARVALATTVSSVLSSLEEQLGRQCGRIKSLIQLQQQFSKPRDILLHVSRMVDATKHAKTNEQLASILHHRLLELQDGDGDIRRLSSRIVCEVAKPSLELLAEWMGTMKEHETVPIPLRDSFVATDTGASDDDQLGYVYRSEMMPRFISPEDGNTIFETGLSLRFLKRQHPEHPLVRLHNSEAQPPEFEWAFAWQDIEAISTKAKSYENRLRQSLLAYSRGSDTYAHVLCDQRADAPLTEERRTTDLEEYFEESMRNLDAPPRQSLTSLPDEIQLLMEEMLNATSEVQWQSEFSPPLSLTSSLSFRPLIEAQAKLVNAATLRLFFRTHELRHHLALQRQYHLLGDGVFSSLLATALFDPDRESAERRKGQMRSGVHMGLQLGSRTSWPPASSELRLALRGVLSESYYSSSLYHSLLQSGERGQKSTSVSGRDNDELPGQLNFAIRNLSEAEQEKVMDPDALPALDFLRLQYVPPTPLNLIITSAALDKYDLVFKFLLRLLRMLFVIAHLPQRYTDLDSRRFKVEAHHFVTTFAGYVFQSGIAGSWSDFDTFVASLETRLKDEDGAGEYGTRVTEGIASLRDAHEKCLDSIMFSLFLRKRQRKILALVDEIFDHILFFAKMQHPDANVDESMQDLYEKLRGKIRVFLSVCRSLTGKKDYGSGQGTAEENLMERLVLGMEMNGYFSGA